MTEPRNAVATKKGRYYVRADERFVSVTNVIDTMVNKPALVSWAAKLVAQEAVALLANPASAARMVTDARRVPDDLVKELKGVPYAAREEAAAFGSRIHDLSQRHGLDQDLGDLTPDEAACVEQFLAFCEDFRPAFEATEATVCNRALGCAGTLDAILRFPADLPCPEVAGRLLVVDYKTGSTGPYPEWAVQLSAYAHAEHLWLDDGTEVPMPAVDGAAILRIRPDFYALHLVTDTAGPFRVFTVMCEAARWFHDETDGLITDPVIPSPTAVEVA